MLTVLVVEHDRDIISIADEVIDVGPLAEKNGGKMLFQGTYEELLLSGTKTGNAMKAQILPKETVRKPKGFLPVRVANAHNALTFFKDNRRIKEKLDVIPIGCLKN